MTSTTSTSCVTIPKPPLPPFTLETAKQKVKAAQNAWNTKNPDLVKDAYTPDCIWRNRDTFLQGQDEIVAFLTEKWQKEKGYRLRKELFAFTDNKIAVQFWYEYYTTTNTTTSSSTSDSAAATEVKWFRAYGLEDWTFANNGQMCKRMNSTNDVEISEDGRWFGDEVMDVNGVEIGERDW